ncbi:signal peptidase II [Petroclostridium sp. X23]|jgi:signal peptidase II|uniref:signal peptidase II n=1 Tax=Petroclostridium sp. X23 TaxID=3045146 RepID=UPI0024ADA730|nr:signal peptidase II [Petroclostridium sp. X23]WHH60545.1 signal peptidase II [Petroclostridium sp. X23]
MMIFYALFILTLIAIDQIAKITALKLLADRNDLPIIFGPVQFTIVKNPGAAFGLLKNRKTFLRIITAILIASVVIYFANLLVTETRSLLIRPLAFIIGGAVSNYLDRLRLGSVIDFLSLNIKKFPVVNFADIFIFAGSILFILNS